MRAINRVGISVLIVCISYLPASPAEAQPSPGQLEGMIIDKNDDRLTAINVLEITVVTEDGVLPENTTRYVKRSENGRTWLEPDDSERDADSGFYTGMFNDQMPELIGGAGSVENEMIGDLNVYRVFIDDEQLLNRMVNDEMEFDDVPGETNVKSATVWIDRDDLIVRKLLFEMSDEQDRDLTLQIMLDDYREYSGLPISHKSTFQITGLETRYSERELEEARRGLDEFRKQLEQMPEAQRRMIEQQMKPQIERMESMLETGELGDVVFLVKEVKVNP